MEIRVTEGGPIEVKTSFVESVYLRCGASFAEIPIIDFLIAVEYVLTNVDLEPNDPRLLFVERIKASRVDAGWNPGGKRIHVASRLDYLVALKSSLPPSR